jgi:glycosyltransferase involved in cell wall biosynthesis
VGTFLSEAVESILAQTYTRWELILVDDGSTDESREIARSYADKYPEKIRATEHPGHANKGVCASRNYAVSISNAEFLAFLDGDDVWMADKLENQLALFDKEPETQMLCEAAEYWYYSENPPASQVIQVGKERDRLFYPPELIDQLYPLADGQAPCPSAIMIRKSAVLRNGGFEEHFKGHYQMYEDQAFLVKMYLNEPVYISSKYHIKYRQRRGSLVADVNQHGIYKSVRLYFLEWMETYLKDRQNVNPKVDKLLKKALEPYRSPASYFIKRLLYKVVKKLK